VKQPAQPGSAALSALRAVVFDVGEVLIDETRQWGEWADWLEVSRHTFSAVFGAVIAQGEDHRTTFQVLRPGFDLELERRRREEAGRPDTFGPEDLYPDARTCLGTLRARGFTVGVAANQPAWGEAVLRSLDLPADWVGTSAGWGVEKPSPTFFERVVARCRCRPEQVAYVGDRVDNDLVPALAAGLVAVFLRRGPWAYLSSADPQLERAHLCVEDLKELIDRLGRPAS
jgi:FMN phosphatase YigB (HAD superfamily)